MKIFPLGDSAVTIDLGNLISEALNLKILAMSQWILERPVHGLRDVITAYSSLTLLYNPLEVTSKQYSHSTAYEIMRSLLEQAYREAPAKITQAGEPKQIPVCYDESFGPDLQRISEEKQLSRQAIIQLHSERTYRVYMIGFLPGFAYMGETNALLHMPRKSRPLPVMAGSIGITGKQTGIYPLDSPGGWHIIGRTPVKQFDPMAEAPVMLQPGDLVRFYPITSEAFYQGPWKKHRDPCNGAD